MPSISRKSKKGVATEPEPEPAPPTETEPEPEPEPDNGPTFPNIVILKQTEHNYIVKHNIDPTTVAMSSMDAGSNVYSQEDRDDLVTPNQIHKNQINKKRGRKPKAGLISATGSKSFDITEVPNIILHLKCHMSDLKTNDSISNYGYIPAIEEVESYNISNTRIQSCDIGILTKEEDDDENDGLHAEYSNTGDYQPSDRFESSHYRVTSSSSSSSSSSSCSLSGACAGSSAGVSAGVSSGSIHPLPIPSGAGGGMNTAACCASGSISASNHRNINVIHERNTKEIMKKINRLKFSFHNGESLQSKINHKSACFWDTCEFDTQVFYIPIMIVNDTFQVYGCFCSPECAVAFLLKEPIDTSTKFERLHLIQLLYGTPDGRGIKPAPNPYYLLDKYYGNLSIQEYRQLLKGTQLIHVVNKPLTHILPELYEDNNDFLVNSKVIPTNNMKLKKRYKTMVVQNNDA
jgi:hypothetical protein